MAWGDMFQQAFNRQSSPTSSPSTSYSPNIQWAPDYSSFYDASKTQGKQVRWNAGNKNWMGQYDQNPGWEMMGDEGWGAYNPFEQGDVSYLNQGQSQYDMLKGAGQWNLTDPNSGAFKYLDHLARTDPYGLSGAMSKLGVNIGNDVDKYSGRPTGYIDALIAGGIDPATAERMAQESYNQGKAMQYQANKSQHGGLGGVIEGFGDIATATAPIWGSALGMHLLGPGAGAVAESASAGGTAGAAAGAGAGASGSGLLAAELAAPTLADMAAFPGLAAGGAAGAGAGLLSAELAAPTLADMSAFPGLTASGGGAAAGAGLLEAELAAPTLADMSAFPEMGTAAGAAGPGMAPGETGAFDQFGSVASPGGAADGAMGAGSVFEGAAAPNFLEKMLGMPAGTLGGGMNGGGGYTPPVGAMAGWLGEYVGSEKAGDQQMALLNRAIESDLWRQQQSKYFDPLYSAATQGIGNTPYGQSIADSTMRKMAGKGYGQSGNMLHEIAQGLNGGTIDYLKAVGPLAMGRGESNAIPMMAGGIAQNTQNQYGALGGFLNSVLSGQQPVDPRRPRNKSLLDIFGWSL